MIQVLQFVKNSQLCHWATNSLNRSQSKLFSLVIVVIQVIVVIVVIVVWRRCNQKFDSLN